MNTIIVGSGRVGIGIAQYLSKYAHLNITIIEPSPEEAKKIADQMDVRVVVGNPYNPEVLRQADAQNASQIIAVTDNSDINILTCKVASSVFDISTRIAWIKDKNAFEGLDVDIFSKDNLAIDVIIKPEEEIANTLWNVAQISGILDIFEIVDDKIVIACATCVLGSQLINTPLSHLKNILPNLDLIIMLVTRDGKIFIPDAETILQNGDEVYFAVPKQSLSQALESFGCIYNNTQSMVIYGAGSITRELLSLIAKLKYNIQVTVVEKDQAKAEGIAQNFPETTVILGDALEQSLATNCCIPNVDVVVAITDDDKTNMLSSIFAKCRGTKRVIALLNDKLYTHFTPQLGVDCTINPRASTISTILRYIKHSSNIQRVHTLRHEMGEVIEGIVDEGSTYTGTKIKNINVHNEIMVMFIVRNNEIIMPHPDQIINAGDQLTIIALGSGITKVEKAIGKNTFIFKR